jgi:DNA-binding NarL/FixJ family response regulator
MIRVLIVDDHRLVRAGLRTLLAATADIEVVGEAGDGAAAIATAQTTEPDVVLMDLSMPVLDGVAATRAVLELLPPLRIVALTSFADHARVNEILAAGAIGYLLKDCSPEELLAAIRAAAGGHTPIDARVAGALLPSRATAPESMLSAREREVLGLVAEGLANKQIGRALGISERTVKVHVGNIFRRIGVTDRTSAALWGRQHFPEPRR